jgi:hypothetical protein
MRLPLLAALLALAATTAFAQTEKVYTPTIVPVGKWAERAAFDGKDLWVAESGQRSIAQIAPNGTITRHAEVGRLPVDMVATGGKVYSVARTDQMIWRNTAPNKFKWLPEHPEGLATDGASLWALTWPDGSSRDSRVIKVDLANGNHTPTRNLGEWGQVVAAGHGKVWVGHVRGQRLSVIDAASLAVEPVTIKDASFWAIATNKNGVFAAGRIGDNNNQGVVVAIDPKTNRETARWTVNQRIAHLAADEQSLVMVGAEGAIWVVSPKDLTPQSVGRLNVGQFQPSSVLIQGDKLVIVAQQYKGENGAVFTVSDWR